MNERMSLAALDVCGFTSLATLDATPPPLNMAAHFPDPAPQNTLVLKDFNFASTPHDYGSAYFGPEMGGPA